MILAFVIQGIGVRDGNFSPLASHPFPGHFPSARHEILCYLVLGR